MTTARIIVQETASVMLKTKAAQEIARAVELWTSGSPVPGTGEKTIDGAKMQELFNLWISGKPIAESSGASYQGESLIELRVDRIKVFPDPVRSANVITFAVEGTGIAGIEAEVFNLADMKVFQQETAGKTLEFQALDSKGRPLANGVYLYVVTVRGFDGKTIRSEVRKLVILR
jgi:hypothetical protein